MNLCPVMTFPQWLFGHVTWNYRDMINLPRLCSEQTHCIGALIWSHRETSVWSGLTVLESEQRLAWLYVSSLIEHECQCSLKTKENVALQPCLTFSLDALINHITVRVIQQTHHVASWNGKHCIFCAWSYSLKGAHLDIELKILPESHLAVLSSHLDVISLGVCLLHERHLQ